MQHISTGGSGPMPGQTRRAVSSGPPVAREPFARIEIVRPDIPLGSECRCGPENEATLTTYISDWLSRRYSNLIAGGYVNHTYHIPDFGDRKFEYPDFVTIFKRAEEPDAGVYIMFSDAKSENIARGVIHSSVFQYRMIKGKYDYRALERLSTHRDALMSNVIKDIVRNPYRPLTRLPGFYFNCSRVKKRSRYQDDNWRYYMTACKPVSHNLTDQ